MAEQQPMKGPGPKGPRGPRPQVKNPGKLLRRVLKYVFRSYALLSILAVCCIFISVLANVQGTLFTKTLIDSYILPMLTQPQPDFGSLAQRSPK